MRSSLAICLLFICSFVSAQPNVYIRFPDDLFVMGCADIYHPPVLYNPDSLPITIDYEDFVFPLITDVCYTIERTWYIRNINNDATLPWGYVPNPAPEAGSPHAPGNRNGPTISAPGNAIPGWEPTLTKIYFQDAQPTDYSVFYTGGNFMTFANNQPAVFTVPALDLVKGFVYKQRIDIIDTVRPAILTCPTAAVFFPDTTPNSALFWQADEWFDPLLESHDLQETPVSLTINTTDDCTGNGVNIRYTLFLDLNRDGVQETVVDNSNAPVVPGQINYGNINSLNNSGGQPQVFDQRPVMASAKYKFGLQESNNGPNRICTLGWHSDQAPNVWVPMQLPTGTHRIQWTVEDGCGNLNTCDYFFTVGDSTHVKAVDYFIRFPDDAYSTDCSDLYMPPVLSNPDSLDISMEYEDIPYDGVPLACIKFDRNWLIKGPHYDPALPCTRVPNPHPNAGTNAMPLNRVGVTVSAPGNLQPGWEPTTVKIDPQDAVATNYALFYTGGYYNTYVNGIPSSFNAPPVAQANCYQYVQQISIVDVTPPTISSCPVDPFFPDTTANDSLFWNAAYWLDPVNQSHDLRDNPVLLPLEVTDPCSGASTDIHFFLFLDLDRNGVQETVINSNNAPPAGQVMFGNAFNPNYAGGVAQDFDQRPVPSNEKYRFLLQNSTSGLYRSAQVGWYSATTPGTWIQPQLPPGNHRIKWITEDNCGNTKVCDVFFTVTDSNAVVSSVHPGALGSGQTLRVAPNPATGESVLYLENLGITNANFDLYDGYGRLVCSRPVQDNQVLLDKPNLPTGLYFYKISTAGKVQATGKLSLISSKH